MRPSLFTSSGLSFADMEKVRSKTSELNRRLQPFCKARQAAVADFKLDNLILPSDFVALGRSKQGAKIVFDLNGADAVTAPHYTTEQINACRNYLMAMICITNATRASNLINLTLQDLKEAKHDAEFDALCILSKKYKTSLLYGRKAIVLPEELYGQLSNFVTHLRPRIADASDATLPDDEKAIFLCSGSGSRMTHSTISNGLTHLFKSVPELRSKKRY